MGIFDIILAIVLIFALVRGVMTGLLMQLSLIVGVVLGILFTNSVSRYLIMAIDAITETPTNLSHQVIYIITFALIVIITYIAMHYVRKIVKTLSLGWIDSIAGAIFCFAKYVVIISVVLNLYGTIYTAINNKPSPQPNGVLYGYIQPIVPILLDYAKDYGISPTSYYN